MSSQTPQLKLELIRAVAGAGKTYTLVEKVMSCVLDYYQKKQTFPRIAVATFTRKATSELKERLINMAISRQDPELIEYVSYSPKLQVSTLHGIFRLFLDKYGSQIGLTPNFTITNEQPLQSLFLSVLKEQLFERKIGINLLEHYSFTELQDIVKQYILYVQQTPVARPFNLQELKSDLLDTNQQQLFVDVSAQLQKLGLAVLNSWQTKKKQVAQISFNDLETMTLELISLKNNRQLYLLPQWDFWFLDEYQDTSLLQNKILDVLTKGSQVFIVGDPQQSIYYFRGSDSSVFLSKQREAQKRLDGQFTKIVKNYRSDANLIAFFNDFFGSFEKMDFQLSKCDCQKETARFIWVTESGDSNRKKQLQFEQTFAEIKNLLNNQVDPKNIVVLSRKNQILNECARYLKRQQIPVRLHSAGAFRRRREIKDALFILRFLCNPYDNKNLVGVLRAPYWRIPDPEIIDLLEETSKQSKKLALWTIALKHIKKYGVVSVLDNYLKESNRLGIVVSFQNILENCGLLDLAYYQDPTGFREAHLWKLIDELKQYEQKKLSSGEGSDKKYNLLTFVDSLLEEDDLPPEGGDAGSVVSAVLSSGVQLMTIHAAKGLEFDHVILLDIGSRLITQTGNRYFVGEEGEEGSSRWSLKIRSLENDKRISSPMHEKILAIYKNKELEEGDRLLYVALTRAKKTVTLIGAGKSLEKPLINSWVSRFSFFKKLKAPGQYSSSHYTYRYLLIDHQEVSK